MRACVCTCACACIVAIVVVVIVIVLSSMYSLNFVYVLSHLIMTGKKEKRR